MKKSIIPYIVSLLLCSCGFHLRGMIDIPTWLSPVAVVSHANSKELEDLLKSQLKAYKITLSEEPSKAQYWLIINYSTLTQKLVSIGSSTNSRQYQLILTTEYQLNKSNGQVIKSPRTIQVSRQFTLNNDRILGSNQEESLFIGEMRQETAVQMINRLSKQ
ncbi:MAG: hypothetical protein CK426_03465 [Legionella sp.]|nr:MAG: hypothetical protein CK423_06210 [Legionella sp.]PJD99228.1 MAG: hypothetical protein CK426_03465 [Legionella sp.]